jgi:hypothetical protein
VKGQQGSSRGSVRMKNERGAETASGAHEQPPAHLHAEKKVPHVETQPVAQASGCPAAVFVLLHGSTERCAQR